MIYLLKIENGVVTSRARLHEAPGRDYTALTSDPSWQIVGEAVYEAAPLLSTKAPEAWTFTPAPPVVNTRVSRFEFSRLLSAAERLTIRTARAANLDATLIDAIEGFELLEYVDLADPRVAPYLDLLIVKGIIAPERKAQILAGQAP